MKKPFPEPSDKLCTLFPAFLDCGFTKRPQVADDGGGCQGTRERQDSGEGTGLARCGPGFHHQYPIWSLSAEPGVILSTDRYGPTISPKQKGIGCLSTAVLILSLPPALPFQVWLFRQNPRSLDPWTKYLSNTTGLGTNYVMPQKVGPWVLLPPPPPPAFLPAPLPSQPCPCLSAWLLLYRWI